jgi:FtsP/CotA-like multicopper oxidase with cupredoxin domain
MKTLDNFKMTRRQILKAGLYGGAGMMLPWRFLPKAQAVALANGLSDPALQPKFVEYAPNALDPAFLYKDLRSVGNAPDLKPNYTIRVRQIVQETGLVDPKNNRRLRTSLYGYGNETVTWPGQTIQVMNATSGGAEETVVRWVNELQGKKHLLPVDTSLHWCYSLHGDSSANGVDYRQYSIQKNGIPIITHVHGGNTDFQFDGNPEFFYSPDGEVKGPQWDFVEGGFTNTFRYNNYVPAGNLWYHDHALGITRLNVYAGLAGFYFIRDEFDTGMPNGKLLSLPAFPYELAYAIQDRMFTSDGALFYPAFPGDPAYADFIPPGYTGPLPTALAEFFGDHMVVNGKIWPKADVEPRQYRLRLLNGCDSRFMVIRFRAAGEASDAPTDLSNAGGPIPFYVIGSDQGLASSATMTDTLVFEPGGRYDIIFDFSDGSLEGKRIIMENIGGDAPFGGDFGSALAPEDLFDDRQTDRIMAFDVVKPLGQDDPGGNHPFNPFIPSIIDFGPDVPETTITRKVALFEGMDEFGRLQPLLGTLDGDTSAGLGYATPYTWFQPTTENPGLGTTEIWEIYNFTADAHPVHLHLVNFEIMDRQDFEYQVDGNLQVLQHNGQYGTAPNISGITLTGPASVGGEYVENAPKDMVTSLPGDPEGTPPTGQMVRVRAKFDKPGRYVWHCHILSHEDHEMMRVLHVGPGA